jgi:hypothetical protein
VTATWRRVSVSEAFYGLLPSSTTIGQVFLTRRHIAHLSVRRYGMVQNSTELLAENVAFQKKSISPWSKSVFLQMQITAMELSSSFWAL